MYREKDLYLRAALVAVLFATAVALVGYCPPAIAQETEEETTEEFADEIVVTGSLIPRPTLEAMSPVSVLEPETITYSGVTRIEDLVRQMPQVFSQQNSTIANGSTGSATVDLRNLGSQRTLVLINGRRMVAGDIFSNSADLNFIPSSLVKRVDVLTGGASSVYGADAVTGVVNFILDTDFEGVRGGISWAAYQHNNDNKIAQGMNEAAGYPYPTGNTMDGDNLNINLAIGGKFADGKGHASIYFDHRNINSLTKSERDYLNCSPGFGPDGPTCSGSGTIPQGHFWVYDPDWNYVTDYVNYGRTLQEGTGETFNYGPYNHMQRPDEKYAAGSFLNYKFNDLFEVYGEIMFMDDYSEAQIAPSGSFGLAGREIHCDSPMLSDQQRQVLCIDPGYGPTDVANVFIGRRSVETGPRTSIFEHTSWRLVSGLRGDINDQWSYDVYGLYAEVANPAEYIGDLDVAKMTDALHVVGDPNDSSTWECASGNTGCVPWNIFEDGGVTPEAGAYIKTNLVSNSGLKTELINGTMTGDLEDYGIKLPSAIEGVQVAFGAEYRSESMYVHADSNWENNNASGLGGGRVRIDGSYYVKEAFFETRIPVLQDQPMARDLSFELGFRYSDYSTAGGHDTWKAQGSWEPVEQVKFRMGFAKATRAPNIRDLYAPQGLGLGGSEDPCTNDPDTGVPSMSLEGCVNTGLDPVRYGNLPPNPADQYNTYGGGSLTLDPETADTITFGVVLAPVPGLSIALDYYDIEITDTIGYIDADTILTACGATGDPAMCDLINRDPQTGSLWQFQTGFTNTQSQNIGTLYSEAIDLNLSYLTSIGNAGLLSTSMIGTYMLTNRYADPIVDYDCVGYYGSQCAPYPTPEWSHMARVSWETNFDFVLTLGWRYITAVTIDDASPDEDLANPGALDRHRINGTYENPAIHYFDLAAVWNFNEHAQLVVGCNNIMDKEPPLGPNMNDNDYGPGFYGFYDPYGRYVHAAIHFDF